MAKKKYSPVVRDEVSFYHGKVKHTGTINWIGSSSLTVYPNSVKVTDNKKQPLCMEWTVFFKDVVGKVNKSTLEGKK